MTINELATIAYHAQIKAQTASETTNPDEAGRIQEYLEFLKAKKASDKAKSNLFQALDLEEKAAEKAARIADQAKA